MPKVIKFRVWSKSENRWITNNIMIGASDGLPLIHFIEVNDNKEIKNHVYLSDKYQPVIQQFTGLLDKNNKEIYEGDILVIPDNNPPEYSNALVQVIWCSSGWAYKDSDTNKIENIYSLIGNAELDEDAAIIGNIFENPDLIKND